MKKWLVANSVMLAYVALVLTAFVVWRIAGNG